MYGKSNIETYITVCKIDSHRNLLYGSETQKGALYHPRGVGCGGRWDGGSKGRVYIYIHTYTHGEGIGNPLQYSCLENPMNGGAWWAAVHGVTKSRT